MSVPQEHSIGKFRYIAPKTNEEQWYEITVNRFVSPNQQILSIALYTLNSIYLFETTTQPQPHFWENLDNLTITDSPGKPPLVRKQGFEISIESQTQTSSPPENEELMGRINNCWNSFKDVCRNPPQPNPTVSNDTQNFLWNPPQECNSDNPQSQVCPIEQTSNDSSEGVKPNSSKTRCSWLTRVLTRVGNFLQDGIPFPGPGYDTPTNEEIDVSSNTTPNSLVKITKNRPPYDH